MISPVSRYVSTALKIHGFPHAARPIATAAQPVSSIRRFADGPSTTSPLPMTGMCTADTTFAIIAQSASP